MTGPLHHPYNLSRLGQAGDTVTIDATVPEREALAAWAGVLGIEEFSARVDIRKLSPTRFALDFAFKARLVQACVVTLADVSSEIEKQFLRELHYTPSLRRLPSEVVLTPEDDELPEEIDTLQYDLGAPLAEELLLAIDPYPRAPQVEFTPPQDAADAPESPFAALKGLKSRL